MQERTGHSDRATTGDVAWCSTRNMTDPGWMTPAEQEQAHALLTRALTDPNWRTASQALDDLMRKLLMVHRLLEAAERLAKRRPRAEPL
jgi:hypothetical protein